MENIKNYWNRIEQWLTENKPEGLNLLAEGASEAEIAAFETEMGLCLPADFRASVGIHNGFKKAGILLNDGRDNFELLTLDKIKEAFHARNRSKEEIVDSYEEAGRTFNERDLPVLYFYSGDYTCLNTKSGKLSYVSHDGDSSELKNVATLLKMNADYLESGRFHINEYGSIGPVYIDETWKKVAEIPAFNGQLNEPMKRTDVDYKALRNFFKAGGKSFRGNLNEHFYRTYTCNHNGQKGEELLFHDGQEALVFLSVSRIIEDYETLPATKTLTLPIFKNPRNGNTIFIAAEQDSYNSSILYKKYQAENAVRKLDMDLIDILLTTIRFHPPSG